MINWIIIPLLGFIVGWLTVRIVREVVYRQTMSITVGEHNSLSWASQQLIKEYYKLPDSNRPYANIKAVVKALDTKHGLKEVNHHFMSRGYESSSPSWSCGCYGSRCNMFPAYVNLRHSFEDIHKALEEQQHQLALAGVGDALSEVERLAEALREEKNLINQVTQELVQ